MIMMKDPSIISIDEERDDVIYLSYTRKEDLTDWKYVCKIDGTRIIWAANPGRWRNHPNDPRLSFVIDGKSIAVKIKYSETSSVQKTYALDEL